MQHSQDKGPKQHGLTQKLLPCDEPEIHMGLITSKKNFQENTHKNKALCNFQNVKYLITYCKKKLKDVIFVDK